MSVRILEGDCRAVLATLPDASVQMCVTSPPYFGLRDYGTASWQGGDAACDHLMPPRGGIAASGLNAKRDENGHLAADRKSQPNMTPYAGDCGKCGAKRIDAQIGLEATVEDYVAQLVAVFRAVWRVLRDDGTLWLNLGDSYAANGVSGLNVKGATSTLVGTANHAHTAQHKTVPTGLKPKDLIGIPWRVAFALQADGWYLRSDIIWAKPNPMPESVRDRPTKSHEYLFLMSKQPRYFFDAEAVKEDAQFGSRPGTNFARVRQGDPRDKRETEATTVYGGDPSTGRNIRSVWTIATAPFAEAHFATFPPQLAERCIKAGSAAGNTVLDPFAGAGTVGLVADRLGRDAVLIELNPAYAAMARRRITGDAPMFAVVGE